MAISSIVGKTNFKASSVWGKCRVPLYSAVTQGALIAVDTTNNGWILADASNSIPASLIAMQAGAAGDTIWACAAAVVRAEATNTSGVFTDTYIAAAGDVTSPLYVGESGDLLLAAGTIAQVVGFVLSRTEFFLCPNTWLTGVNISASGTLTVTGNSTLGGTLGVTGNTTLTGTLAANNTVTVASGKNVVMTKGGVIEYVGTASKDAEMATPGYMLVDTSSEDVTITLPTAVAGWRCGAVCTSATKQLTVAANSSDKLIDASGAAKDSAKANAAAYSAIYLLAVDATNWVTTSFQGTWTYS